MLRISLEGVTPEIWRRIRVFGDLPLSAIHVAIQVAMGWEARHLYGFDIDGEHFGSDEPDEQRDDDPLDTISFSTLVDKGDSFYYTYDFGDNWRHHVVVEDVGIAASGNQPAVCLSGAEACPPEDCGGSDGFLRLREEGEFDAEAFDLEEVNMDLTEIFGLPDFSKYDFIDHEGKALPYQYNADTALDKTAWSHLSADEHVWAVAASHYWLRLAGKHRDVDVLRTHAFAHATIELQIATGRPAEVGAAVERMVARGTSRHEAIHAVADVMDELMETRLALFEALPGGSVEDSEERISEAISDHSSDYHHELAQRLGLLGTDRSKIRN